MAAYGRFEVVRDGPGGRAGSSILIAKEAGTSRGEEAAIKVFAPPRTVIGRVVADRQLESFLARVAVQKKLGELTHTAWAPILDSGRAEGEVFYVTRLYPRSAQELLDGHVRLSSQALKSIALGVALGLSQIHKTAGRAHGNLKATNVLIDRSDRINQTGVFLTDPGTDERANSGGEREDLEALGHLMHELIVGTDAASQEDWSGSPAKAWSHLGAAAGSWRDLCNRLTAGNDDNLTLETLPDEIRKIRAAGRFPSKLLAALVIMLVLGLFGAAWEVDQRSKFAANWDRISRAYADTVLPLQRLNNIDGSALTAARPDIAKQLFVVMKAAPDSWAQCRSLDDLRDKRPPFTNAGINPDLEKAIGDLKEDWKTDKWELRKALLAHSGACSREFPGTAGMFSSIVLDQLDHLNPPISGGGVPDRIPPEVIDVVKRATEINANADVLLAQLAIFKSLGIANADLAISKYYRDSLESDVNAKAVITRIETLARTLKDAPADGDWKSRCYAAINDNWVTGPLDPVGEANTIYAQTPPSLGPDPRAPLAGKLADIRQSIPATDPNAQSLKKTADGIQGKIDQNSLKLQWSYANKTTIENFRDTTELELNSLKALIPTPSVNNQNPPGGDLKPDQPPVGQPTTDLDALLEPGDEPGVPAGVEQSRGELWKYKWAQFKAENARKSSDRAAMLLAIADLKALVNSPGPDFDALVPWPADLEKGGDELKAALRQKAEVEFIQFLHDSRLLALKDFTRQTQLSAWNDSVSKAKDLVANCAILKRALTNGDEPNYLPDINSIENNACCRHRAVPVAGAQNFGPARDDYDQPTVDAVYKLLPIDAVKKVLAMPADRELLSKQMVDRGPEVPEAVELVAWRRMARVKDWPATPDERKVEQASYSRLMNAFRTRQAVSNELGKEESRRARQYIAVAAGPKGGVDELIETKAWIDSLSVAPAEVSAAAQFDFALAKLKKDVAGSSTADEAQQKALAFADAVPANFAREVTGLRPSAGGTSGNAPGPFGSAKWTVKKGPAGVSFTHNVAPSLQISFIKLPGCYMLSGEVSVQLFNVLAGDAGADGWPKLSPIFKGTRGSGPRAWRPVYEDDGKTVHELERQRLWFELPSVDDGKKYVKSLEPVPDNPPMQFLAPASARLAARLLNCRLPTENEWRDACNFDGQRAPGHFDRGDDNLRDLTWQGAANKSNALVQPFSPESAEKCFSLLRDSFAMHGKVAPLVIPSDEINHIYQHEDRTVLFRNVQDERDKFHDLVGNVAEYVTDTAGGDEFGVIGGSALTPNTMPLDKKQPLDGTSRIGYSDVGFRLVFDAPGESSLAEIKKKVEAVLFLTP